VKNPFPLPPKYFFAIERLENKISEKLNKRSKIQNSIWIYFVEQPAGGI